MIINIQNVAQITTEWFRERKLPRQGHYIGKTLLPSGVYQMCVIDDDENTQCGYITLSINSTLKLFIILYIHCDAVLAEIHQNGIGLDAPMMSIIFSLEEFDRKVLDEELRKVVENYKKKSTDRRYIKKLDSCTLSLLSNLYNVPWTHKRETETYLEDMIVWEINSMLADLQSCRHVIYFDDMATSEHFKESKMTYDDYVKKYSKHLVLRKYGI